VRGKGFRVEYLGVWFQGLRFRFKDLGLRVLGFRLRFEGLEFSFTIVYVKFRV
jgi:hypothetical protein